MSPDVLNRIVALAFRDAVGPIVQRLTAVAARLDADGARVADTVRQLEDRIAALDAARLTAAADAAAQRRQLEDIAARPPVEGPPGPAGPPGPPGEPGLRYQGCWSTGTTYRVGDVVTEDGSCWHCHAATDRARPGTDSGAACWRLMVKRGDRGRR